ncbi:MAG: mechanosensitive ion channel [Deltaproteobacteria bacterium]|nr:mechanosensitive ion channel [Deltaproteobacteria bacterium]
MGNFSNVDISWAAVALAITTVFIALFARRLLPPDRADRGRLPIIFLLSSVALRALAVPIEMGDYHDLVTGVKLAAAITLAAGMTGIIGKLLFDIVVSRFFEFPTILRDILLFIAFVIALMTILQQSGANLVSLVTTSAVLTAVIGLALQQPIANMFAGLSLQLDRTIVVGDWIKIDDRIGRIEKISFRATTISTRDNDTLTFPNTYFMTHAVLNYSKPTATHRMWADVGIAYRHPPNEVKAVLEEALRGCPGVLDQPAPRVVLRGFGDSGVQYSVLYWITDYGQDVVIESDVRTRIWYATQRAGLEIPFPIRTVHMHQITEETTKAGADRDQDARRAALRRVELFAKLAGPDLDLIARGMKRRLFSRGEVIVRQGDPGDSLFLIDEGEVSVVLSVDGAERQVATLKSGDILGELSLMTGESRAATCIAAIDVQVHELSHELVRELLEAKPTLAENFSVILTDRQHSLEAEREGLNAEAAASRHDETKQRLLGRIRSYFRLA